MLLIFVLTKVFSGQAGANLYANKGGGTNYLCLPSDPENGELYSYDNDGLYGAEYEVTSSNKPSWLSASLYNTEVPCAVCIRQGKSSMIMIPGKEVHLLELLQVNVLKLIKIMQL